jgi:WD40 repeat protein
MCGALLPTLEETGGLPPRCPSCDTILAFPGDAPSQDSGATPRPTSDKTVDAHPNAGDANAETMEQHSAEIHAATDFSTDDSSSESPATCEQGTSNSPTDPLTRRRGPERLIQQPDIGRFRISGVLGRGGFGTVYLAYDPLLDRTVALKVPRFADESPSMQARFLREAKSAARLRHPNIVTIFESGQAGEHPYIVSEMVDGVPLSRMMRERPPDMRTAVDWVRQVAEALDYAHTEGIIHRDIKPSNIMVNRAGRPQIMDFGLAKRAADTEAGMTMEGQIVGTPAYMAPEQARGKSAEVGTHSDQYSVGVVLYELLCGQTPFVGEAWSVLSRVANVNEVPPAPRKLRPGVPRDLEACCLKALDKDPAARYGRLQEMADDLKRWLEGRPLRARPIGLPERLVRWYRNNRAIAILLAIVVCLLTTAAVVGPIGMIAYQQIAATAEREAEAAKLAREQEKTARLATEQLLIDTYTENGLAADRNGDAREAILWFANAGALANNFPTRERDNRIRVQSWLSDIAIPVHAFVPKGNWNAALRYHPSGRYLLCESQFAPCEIYDLRDGSCVASALTTGTKYTSASAWSPDGKWLALASEKRVAVFAFPGGQEADRWELPDAASCLAFSPDSQHLAVGNAEGTRVRNVLKRCFTTPVIASAGEVRAVAFNADGSRLATRSADDQVRVFPSAADAEPASLLPPQPSTTKTKGKELLPLFVGNNRLIIGDSEKSICCWDVATRHMVWERPAKRLLAVAASPKGDLLAIGDLFEAVLLDAKTGAPVGKPIAHKNFVNDIAFHPDGTLLLSACSDQTARVSQVPSGEPVIPIVPHNDAVHRCAWSPDGSTFATVHWGMLVRVWKLGRGDSRDFTIPLTGKHAFVRASRDGKYLLPTGVDTVRTARSLQVYDAETGAPLGPLLEAPGLITDAAFVKGASLVVTAGSALEDSESSIGAQRLDQPGLVQFLDRATGAAALPAVTTPSAAIAIQAGPDDRTAVVLCQRGEVFLLDASTGEARRAPDAFGQALAAHGYAIRDRIRFSPSGDRFALWGTGPRVELRNSGTGALLFAVQHASDFVHDLQFSPDGKMFVSCGSDQKVRRWCADTGAEAGSPLDHSGWVFSACFSSNGKRLLTASRDHQARLWDLETGQSVLTTPMQSDEVFAVCFTPDEEWFLTGTRDGRISAWDTRLGKMIAPVRHVRDMVYQLTVPAHGSHVIAAGRLNPLRAIDLDGWIRTHLALGSEDQRVLGEILSDQRVHERGAATSLSTDEWLERWRAFRARYPDHPVLRVPPTLRP